MKKEHLKELKQGFSWKVCRRRGFTMKLWESGSGRNLFSLWPTFSLDPVVQEPKAASTSFSPTTRTNKHQLESFHCHMLRLCAVASLWWLVIGSTSRHSFAIICSGGAASVKATLFPHFVSDCICIPRCKETLAWLALYLSNSYLESHVMSGDIWHLQLLHTHQRGHTWVTY